MISDVLSTFCKPTLDALIPVAILSSVTAAVAIFAVVIADDVTIGFCAVPAKSPASRIIPLDVAEASTIFTFELLPFETFIAMTEST